MRRLAFVVLAVAAGVMASGLPVAAEPNGLNPKVSGSFTGTSVFDVMPPCTTFLHQVFDASYSPDHGPSGSVSLDGCVTAGPPQGFAYSGLFVLTAPNGAILNGTVTGFVDSTTPTGQCDPGLNPISLDFTLSLGQGTKGFQHATGTIHLTGTWCNPVATGVPGPISGTLAAALQRG